MRVRTVIPIAIILTLILPLLVFNPSRKVVKLAGSTAFLPYAEQLAEEYMAIHPDTSVDVQGGGSATGIMASLAGIVDVGMVDLVTLPDEVKELRQLVVARDGIAVVVHPTNRVSGVTSEQLAGIFSGRIRTWKELGGSDDPIRVISREEGSGTRKSFDSLVLKKDRLVQSALFQDSNGTIREAVKQDPHAVGYVSISFLDGSIKGLAVNDIAPTNEQVVAGAYALARPIYFLLPTRTNEQTDAFVSFVLGAEGQESIARNGLIPVKL